MSAPDTPRIVAVVVTFNRLGMLQELLATLLAEDALSTVVVVDNASTDGTAEWLSTHPQTGRALDAVLLAQNTGGAGGFKAGMERAVALDAELVWLMDDDGLPEPGCLETLLEHRDRLDFWGPIVVDREDQSRLVFPIRLPGGTKTVRRLADVEAAAKDGLIAGVVIPFNGVLVRSDLIEKIGTVRADYFIWGDDHEYRLRAERAGARIATVVGARVLHPTVGDLGTPMAFGLTTYNHSPSELKHYCMARNNLLNLREYHGWPHALAFVGKTVWFYTFTRPDPRRLRLSLQAMWAGLRGDFTGHRRFLAPQGGQRG